MNKRKFLKKLDNVHCRLKPSTIQGVGVFAIRDIPKGIDPFSDTLINKFVPIDVEDIKNQPSEIKKMINDFCIFRDGAIWMPKDGLNCIDISYYINHSETPNMETKDDGETFITKELIKEGTELTINYSTYSDKLNI